MPGRGRKGELRGLQWEPLFLEWASCQSRSLEGVLPVRTQEFHHFPRWSSCSYHQGGPKSLPDLTHRNPREGAAPV